MRTTFRLVAALLLVAGGAASAQTTDTPPAAAAPVAQAITPASAGIAVIGSRVSDVTGDAYRYQRYRDLSDGAVVDRFRWDRDGATWHFESFADHAGAKDQRFQAAFAGSNRLKASFSWDQIPMNVSDTTRTPYMVASPGVLRVDGLMQQGIQNGTLTLNDLAASSSGTVIDSYRHVGMFDLLYTPVRNLDLSLKVTQTNRKGTQPWAASFAFNNVVEVSAPIDTRTTDVNGAAEWSNPRGMLRVGYNGSWFTNKIQTLVWDNPLKYTDSTDATAYVTGTGGAQGRYAMSPNNTQQAVTTAGSLVLPGQTRMTAALTAGLWNQDQALLPITINSAIDNTPLPRATADAEARTTAVNYTVTSRPGSFVWLSARYRYYDFNNRTPVFQPVQFVVMDQTAHPGVPTTPISYTRQNFDADASMTPAGFAAFKVGYSRNLDERPTRFFARTTEDVYRASADATMAGLFTVRALYERSARRGAGFDEEKLSEAGELPDELRQFDIANRDRDRITGLVQVNPMKYFGLTGSIGSGTDKYPGTGFGLRDSSNRTYSAGVDASAGKPDKGHFSANATYTYERNTAAQSSRTANPATPDVLDPRRDWGLDTTDHADTIGGSLDMIRVFPRTELRFGYDYTKSRSTYVYNQPADTTIAPLLPLPAVTSELETITGDVRYFLTRRVALGATYWYDKYAVDDFATNAATLNRLALPGGFYLGSLFRPYEARTGSVRLIVIW